MKIIKDKEIIETLREASRAVERVSYALETKNIYRDMEHDINFIFNCASDKRKAIWESSAFELMKLAYLSDDIRKKIVDVMQTGKAHEKYAVMYPIYIISEDGRLAKISYSSSFPIPADISKEEIHDYIIAECNHNRIKDLYGSK